MVFKSLFTKGVALAQSGKCRNYSAKASSSAKKAASYLLKEPDAIIPHGVDLKRFSAPINKEDSWNKLNLPGELGIGIFGRVRYSKGIDILVDAAIKILPNHPSVTVSICGETQIEDQPFKKKIISYFDYFSRYGFYYQFITFTEYLRIRGKIKSPLSIHLLNWMNNHEIITKRRLKN